MRRSTVLTLLPVLTAGLLMVLLAPGALQAQEVIVKNDSFVSGGQVSPIGDFVTGEQAGVILTMPADGTIVGIQILWMSLFSGTGESWEQAIHVYEAGSFPNPGDELLTIVAPVLSDGYLNEFRYVDEGTIPINVPVTAGQDVMITLEYANPTNVLGGSASVVADVNGCQAGRNVLYNDAGNWLEFCIYLPGDVVIRAVLDTTPPASTVTCSLTCTPPGGTVPFTTNMQVAIDNTYTGQVRRMAGKINLNLANGTSYANWRAGWTNIAAGSSYTAGWNQFIPALGALIGTNMFTLVAQDVTPSPYNQPPYPASGDTANDVCSVVGIAP